MLEQRTLGVFLEAAKKLDAGFAGLPALEGGAAGIERVAEVLNATATRLQDNYPYFHPLYAGQMLKPPHAIARLASALAVWINPNNHALDGGRASSAMEREAVAEIARMVGWREHLGHLCSGGTMANLEALWVASRLRPGAKVVASRQAHYTHDSPYTYFSSSELHLGEISLECSRPGAAAVGLWATQRLMPLERGGAFAALLGRSRAAALALHARLAADARFAVPFAPELDI